jgi:hypothetical protein
MQCSEIIIQIPQYVSDELSQAQINDFNGHLLACPDCLAVLENYRFLNDKSHQPDTTIKTPDIVVNTMNRIKSISGAGTTAKEKKRLRGWLRLGLVTTSLIISALALIIFLASYLPGRTGSSISTKITIEEGDQVTLTSALMVHLSLDDLISSSDAIIIGKVADILPSKWGTFVLGNRGRKIIYTDVIIQVQKFLYGEPKSEEIAIRMFEGKIGNQASKSENGAEFTVGESVCLFLEKPSYVMEPAPQGINPSNYYVCSFQDKFMYWHGIITNWPDGRFPTCTWFIEMKIAAIHNE